ncbi:MAG: energy-coupling factor transporter ATPase [Bacillota bacterium]
MSIIEVHELTFVYGRKTPFEVTSLQDVSMEVLEGEFLAVAGPTGSGKSTLAQHFNGLLRPTFGSVTVLGINTRDKRSAAGLWEKVGLVFQYPEVQLFGETVYEDIAFGPVNTGAGKEQVDRRVRQAMELVELDYHRFRDLSPLALSAGERRRAAIAGVLAIQPRILVLDEPTAGLDPAGRKRLLGQIKNLQRAFDCTIILVTHNMDDAARWADRIVLLDQGRLYRQGATREIFNKPEELLTIGLDLPFPSTLVHLLRGAGWSIEKTALTIDEAEALVLKARDAGFPSCSANPGHS